MKTTVKTLVVPALLLCALAIQARADEPSSPAAGATAATPESARASMAKWVETQQLIARETREWQQGKEMLESRISLVSGEVAALEEKFKQLRETGSEAAHKGSVLAEEERAVKTASERLAAGIAGYETRLRALAPSLPEPLRAKVEPLYSRMPADPANTKVSVAERYQNVVGILNEIGKFNNDITMVTEVRTLADNTPSEVRVVYLGLAQAWYVSAGGEAGVGRPGGNGWQWEPVGGLAPQVLQVIEVLQSKASPKYVSLPVTLQ